MDLNRLYAVKESEELDDDESEFFVDSNYFITNGFEKITDE